jgi:spore maturation protein CgeB
MVLLNFVYVGHTDEDLYVLRRGDAYLVRSRVPLEGCDLYGYMDAFCFVGKHSAPDVLAMYEPLAVLPGQYSLEVWRHFDAVLTMVDTLVGLHPMFRKAFFPNYQTGCPPLALPVLEELVERFPVEQRRNAICMIQGNKHSHIEGELYSKRIEVAQWFHDHSKMPFDVYGVPKFDLPNYRGECPPHRKFALQSQYRYALCFENSYHPVWSPGYLTEKLLYCFETRTVPIYYGCFNIEEYIPPECFIDYRKYDGNAELSAYLEELPEEEYRRYVEAIDRWIAGDGFRRFSVFHLYNTLLDVYAAASGKDVAEVVRGEPEWQAVSNGSDLLSRQPSPQSRVFWTWPFLNQASDEPATAALAYLKEQSCAAAEQRVQVERAGGLSVPRAAPTRRGGASVRKLLYVGARYARGDFRQGLDYGMWNFLPAWTAWPELEVHHFDFPSEAAAYGLGGMSSRLLDWVRQERPDVLFYVPFSLQRDVLPEALDDIRAETDACVIAWLTDDPGAEEDFAQRIVGHVDYAVTTSRESEERYRALGCGDRIVRSHWASLPATHVPLSLTAEKEATFVGTATEARRKLVDALARAGHLVETYGAGWDENGALPFSEMVRLFNVSRVNVNLGGRRRPFEVTACGGLLVTTASDELAECFEGDAPARRRFAEVVVARDVQELADKMQHYVRRDVERQAIARRGRERLLREHTWAHRYRDIFGRVGWKLPSPPDANG